MYITLKFFYTNKDDGIHHLCRAVVLKFYVKTVQLINTSEIFEIWEGVKLTIFVYKSGEFEKLHQTQAEKADELLENSRGRKGKEV